MNSLTKSSSPYLRQHAGNPVDWKEWGEEAFRIARDRGCPVFLSVGYSTCHWCHVMAHESFEDPEVADVLNRHFVSIKVDREERPDVDRLYMSYVQATTGSGGWPMSVWLTPDGAPIFGGTYFPREDQHGRSGFISILRAINRAWADRPEELVARGREVLDQLDGREAEPPEIPETAITTGIERAIAHFKDSFDAEEGGFGSAPKFPRPVALDFLLECGGEGGRAMVFDTLRKMGRGGIRDHLGGGFHRYSVDAEWHVPHFEKMLYDQAQLALTYTSAWQLTRDEEFSEVAGQTLDYILRDLAHPAGGFFSAEDADSPNPANKGRNSEGAYYVWTAEEIRRVLGNEVAAAFCTHFHILEGGNIPPVSDPHGELAGQNVLHAIGSVSGTAARIGIDPGTLSGIVHAGCSALFEARNSRPRPSRDEKILTGWNGLTISALAIAGGAFGNPAYLSAANRAADFLLDEMMRPDGRLWRVFSMGAAAIDGFCDDYSFAIRGFLDLYRVTGRGDLLDVAVGWQEIQDETFGLAGGRYAINADSDPLVRVRVRADHDGAEPMPDSVAIRNLLELADFQNREELQARALRCIDGWGSAWGSYPSAYPALLASASHAEVPRRRLILFGRQGDAGYDALLRAALGGYCPSLRILHVEDAPEWIRNAHPELDSPASEEPSAQLCNTEFCLAPTRDPRVLVEQIRQESVA